MGISAAPGGQRCQDNLWSWVCGGSEHCGKPRLLGDLTDGWLLSIYWVGHVDSQINPCDLNHGSSLGLGGLGARKLRRNPNYKVRNCHCPQILLTETRRDYLLGTSSHRHSTTAARAFKLWLKHPQMFNISKMMLVTKYEVQVCTWHLSGHPNWDHNC